MTEAERVFNQDIHEKKSIAHSARGKKGSVKGPKGCRLSTDHMTKKEWESKNGPIVEISLNHFYTYEEFKKFSPNLQVEYLNHLCNKYQVGVSTLDRVIFGSDIGKYGIAQRLKQYLIHHGLKDRVNPNNYRSLNGARQLQEDMDHARSGSHEENIVPEVTPEQICNDLRETVAENTADGFNLQEISVTLKSLDLCIFQTLSELFKGRDISVTITVTEVHKK